MASFYLHLTVIYLIVGVLIAGRSLYEFRVKERCEINWLDWLVTAALVVLWLPGILVLQAWAWWLRQRD